MTAMTDTKQLPKTQKPITYIHRYLCRVWGLWLLYRLLGVVVMTVSLTSADPMSALIWQVIVMLPALLLTPIIIKAQSVYGLIVASLVSLIYLACAGVALLAHTYQKAPIITIMGMGAEVALLLGINLLIFILIKRLPPMHKHNRETV